MSEVQAEAAIASENDAPVEIEESTPSQAEETPKAEAAEDKSAVQKRIDKLTWKAHEAERRAQDLEQKLQQQEAPKPNPVEAIKDIPVPNYSDFESDQAYQEALQNYNAQSFARLNEQAEADRKATAEREARQQVRTQYQAKVEKFAAENDGFVEALTGSDVVINNDVLDMVMESEKSAELTYFLAQNAEAAIRLNSLPLMSAARELGRIEASIDSVQPKTVSDAPAPMADLNGSDSVTEGLSDDLSTDEWLKRRRAQLQQRGR